MTWPTIRTKLWWPMRLHNKSPANESGFFFSFCAALSAMEGSMSEAEDHGMGERRQLSQSSVELLDFRIKQLEDARLLIRMQSAETAIDQVRAEVRTIADLSRGISAKLDSAVQELGDRQDEEYQNLHGAQIKFMAFVRAGLWLCGAIGAAFGFFVSFAEPINRIFQALASTPGAGN